MRELATIREMTTSDGLRIAHIGAFAMPNWGDKLYPGALEALLREIGITPSTQHFALNRGSTSAGEPIRTLKHVANSDPELILVGGGDILRFDNGTVAMDHLSVATADRDRKLNKLRARIFQKRHALNGPGAWAPSEPWVAGVPSALISVGTRPVPDRARQAVSNYTAAWVRTSEGAQRLADAGIDERKITVAPDMIFALPAMDHQERTIQRGRELLERRTDFTDAPALFHAAEFHGWPAERLNHVLSGLRDLPVALLSLGAYAGEDRTLSSVAAEQGIPVLTDLTADEITEAMAGAGAVFSTSMHAAIVAASFGTPVLAPGIGKTRDAFSVLPDPLPVTTVDDSSTGEALREALGTRRPSPREQNRAAVVAALRTTIDAARQE